MDIRTEYHQVVCCVGDILYVRCTCGAAATTSVYLPASGTYFIHYYYLAGESHSAQITALGRYRCPELGEENTPRLMGGKPSCTLLPQICCANIGELESTEQKRSVFAAFRPPSVMIVHQGLHIRVSFVYHGPGALLTARNDQRVCNFSYTERGNAVGHLNVGGHGYDTSVHAGRNNKQGFAYERAFNMSSKPSMKCHFIPSPPVSRLSSGRQPRATPPPLLV
ncbi:hypothetical protein J3F83DRAFT_575299 [Trichoderma novae-zelandiae]